MPMVHVWVVPNDCPGKLLDMGKSCLRFRSLDDLALDVVGEAIGRTSVDDLIAVHQRDRY
jgi:hypothetical protein